MIVWLNGPFGAGKTTTAHLLRDVLPSCTVFDPELVGTMLDQVGTLQGGDYQDDALWRRLVVVTAHAVHEERGGTLLVPMTVLHEPYLKEVVGGLAALGPLHHVLLHCDADALRARIDGDAVESSAATWRHYKVEAYLAASSMLHEQADTVVDTTVLPPRAVRDLVRDAVLEVV